MALQPGTLLGPHEIISLIGQGGMGEVYKARDTRLNRIVAIKTLPAHLADRPELRERFKREASTLANLKHAHICTLYDIGSQEIEVDEATGTKEAEEVGEAKEAKERQGLRPAVLPGIESRGGRRSVRIDYLVMEYLEGETLAERLKKGALPLEQVWRYAIELADALDKAHRQGFTHRDIKPANIMLTKEGSKLLDFGLAKLKQEVAKATIPTSEMPTAPGTLTQHGTLLGTLQYMSPEQVEGKTDELDGRTDVFAFGAVVYEMATGKKAFDGKTQASVIAKILEIDPPPMSTLQPMTPPALDRVVKRCLAKDREERWQTALDLWRELEWIKEGGAEGRSLTVAAQIARRSLRERLAWGAAALLLVSTVALAVLFLRRAPSEQQPVRFFVGQPEKAVFAAGVPTPLSISPDGSKLAFSAFDSSGKGQLWIRPLDSLAAQPLPGTENPGAVAPFWSPDGRFLAFVAEGKLKKIAVSGGPPQTVAEAVLTNTATPGSWNRDGVILFTPNAPAAIYRVSAAGGAVTPVTTLDASRQELGHSDPRFLPDGRHFVYFARSANPENNAIYAGSLDSKNDAKERMLVLNAGSNVAYVPPGYLLFQRQGTLLAQPFDADRIQLTGEAFPIAEGVQFNVGLSRAGFAASENGVLAYRGVQGTAGEFVWMDRAGKPLATFGEVGNDNVHFSLAPDEKRIALELLNDVWLLDLTRGGSSRFTFGLLSLGLTASRAVVWSPDGNRLTFDAAMKGAQGLFQKLSSGAGEAEMLVDAPGSAATDVSQDGRSLLYMKQDSKTRYDVWVLPLTGEKKPKPFLQTQFNEGEGRFSPDGRWVAYASDESGRSEVYVQPFPGPGGKWQVSTTGGVNPKWRRDGKELFFLSLGKLMSAEVKEAPQFEAGTPRMLFDARVGLPHTGAGPGDHYAVAADGQRFLILKPKGGSTAAAITVVLNWTAGIKKQ